MERGEEKWVGKEGGGEINGERKMEMRRGEKFKAGNEGEKKKIK